MNIKITLDRADRDRDVVKLADGDRFFFPAWLFATERAAQAVRAGMDRGELSLEARGGVEWLQRCGVSSLAEFRRLEELLPRLRLPPDSPRATTRCRVCGSRIWGRASLLTGIGSGCRRTLAR